MSGYTPGPWHVSTNSYLLGGPLIKPIPGQVVAACDPIPGADANARLIAAAPELLAALQLIIDGRLLDPRDGDRMDEAMDAACAAVAKATGDPS